MFEVLKAILKKESRHFVVGAVCWAIISPGLALAECSTLPPANAPTSAISSCAKDILHDVAGDDLSSFFGFIPTIIITDSRFPQAYALPRGAIIVSRGLIGQLKSPEEFLFVLAHELGHEIETEAPEALRPTALLTGASAQAVNPVANELAADRYALTLLKAHGQSPAVAIAVLKRISHFGETHGVSFSKLYPSIQVRLAALRAS